MAQGITFRFADGKTSFPAPVLRTVGWVTKQQMEKQFPALGELIVEVFDTTDFDFGRSTNKEGSDGNATR